MAHERRTTAAWGGAILTALLLTGCTGEDPTPPPAPAPTIESASPTPKAVVVPPARPAAMDDDGPAGAEAAAVYFFSLDAYMQATGETAEWDAMSLPECSFCAARMQQAQEIATASLNWMSGVTTATVEHTYAQSSTTGAWPIDIVLHQDAAQVLDSDGAVVQEVPRSQAEKRVEVVLQEGHWMILGVGLRPE